MFLSARHLVWPGVLLLGLACHGSVTFAREVPFTGVVLNESAPVYAGAGRSFYLVGELAIGHQVAVEEVIFGWYKITPPPGVFSYIERDDVKPQSGGVAVVLPSRAAVRAASPNGPATSYRRQIDALSGETVQIVGEEGEYYKIVPPPGAYVFLPPGAVSPVADGHRPHSGPDPQEGVFRGPGVRQQSPSLNPVSSVGIPTVQPRSARKHPETADEGEPLLSASQSPNVALDADGDSLPHADDSAVPTPLGPAGAMAVIAAQRELARVQALPMERQPVQDLLSVYQALWKRTDLSPTDRQVVASGLRQLRRRIAVLQALRTLVEAREAVDSGALSAATQPEQAAVDHLAYAVTGRLLASSVYDGHRRPRLFRIVEPGTSRTIAYVVPGPNVRAKICLGRYVGVVGQVRIDPGLKLPVIGVDRVDVLEPNPTPATAPVL